MFKQKKRNAIKTQPVFVKNNQVVFRKSLSDTNLSEEWRVVPLQWIPV